MKAPRYLLLFTLPLAVTLALTACDSGTGGMNSLGGLPGTVPGGTTPGGVTPGGTTPGGVTPGGTTPGGTTPGGSTPGAAGLTCEGILDCQDPCASTDTACLQACFDKGSSAAKAAYNAVATCIQRNRCMDASCLQANCTTEVNACFSMTAPTTPTTPTTPPAGGTLGCQGLLTCLSKCPDNDSACDQACVARSTPQAQSQLGTLIQCLQAKCANAADIGTCGSMMCANEARACGP